MGLQKEYTEKGYTANYWIITDIQGNKRSNDTEVTVRLYKDQATRDSNVNNYIKKVTVVLPGFNKTIAELYALLKSSTETGIEEGAYFSDAQDV